MSVFNKYYLIGALLLLLSAAAIGFIENPPSLASEKVNAFLSEKGFQGTILIAKEGKTLFSKGYGFANEELQSPNTPKTVFRLGSITKIVTAIAVLQLQEQSLLNVQDPIKKFLPDYPLGDEITIHHLLSHSSGIFSITDLTNIGDIQRQKLTLPQTLEYFQKAPLKFKPGTDCEYSDSGYILLGAIIETITKMPYGDYVQKHIFSPLEMHSSTYEYPDLLIPFRASGYSRQENGVLHHANYINMSFPHAAGGLVSTVEDLYKLDRSLKEGTLLSQASLGLLLGIQASSEKNKIAYGYGLRIGPKNQGMEGCHPSIIGHFGSIDGFEGAFVRYGDEDLTIIMLSNIEKTEVESLHKKIAQYYQSAWRSSAD